MYNYLFYSDLSTCHRYYNQQNIFDIAIIEDIILPLLFSNMNGQTNTEENKTRPLHMIQNINEIFSKCK